MVTLLVRVRPGARARTSRAGVVPALLSGFLCLTACKAYDSRLIDKPDEPAPPASEDAGMTSPDAGPKRLCENEERLARCEPPHAQGVCLDGGCHIVMCTGGFVDCDGEDDNGCEATLQSPEHCGACNAACALSRVERHACTGGEMSDATCGIDTSCPENDDKCKPGAPENGCAPGFGDCDGKPDNGCETPLNTLNNCGACGAACENSDSQPASCETGSCKLEGCAPGYEDCGDGCERLLETPDDCGSCGAACPADKAACAGGRCTALDCAAGSADCDQDEGNGCEADLGSPETCGGCDIDCGALAHAQPGCDAGRCVIGSCDPGYADCDGIVGNGCETDLAKPQTCGGCERSCEELPHVASAGCAELECSALSCDEGWGDCDGNPGNGCEQSLNTLAHCGACNAACMPPHGEGACMSGQCTVTSCDPGMDECNDEVEDGCEADLASTSNCGGCGNVCQGSTKCVNGGCGCTQDSDCTGGRTCCDGACIETNKICVWWPCIPGTARDMDNCGACGVRCDKLACCAG